MSTPQPIICNFCGKRLQPGSLKCFSCGCPTALAGSTQDPTVQMPAQSSAPQIYQPPQPIQPYNQTQKFRVCPQCQQPTALQAFVCGRCGHPFQSSVPNYHASIDSGNATAALVCGILSIAFSCACLFSLPLGIVAVVLGSKARYGPNHNTANPGMICGIVGLALTILLFLGRMTALSHGPF
jgi:hypothetical protein